MVNKKEEHKKRIKQIEERLNKEKEERIAKNESINKENAEYAEHFNNIMVITAKCLELEKKIKNNNRELQKTKNELIRYMYDTVEII